MTSLLLNLRWAALAVLCATLVTARGSQAAPAASSEDQIAPYLTPQRVVHIARGRTINLVCLGHGSPTVILTAGIGNWSFHWRLVQRPLAKRTRVCAWDRAGYGFSGPSQEPQDIVRTTEDLERALKNAGIRGPYVMVGHSLGAYETLRFTDLHPASVSGMVLVDPTIPDQLALLQRTAPLFLAKARDQNVKQLQDCAAELRSGTLKPSSQEFERCTAANGVPSGFPRLQQVIARLNADPKRLLTRASAEAECDGDSARDSREAVNAHRRYGDMPLIVLTAKSDESEMLQIFRDDTPDELAQLRKQVTQFLQEALIPGQDAYAALSTRGRRELVDSGHAIQSEKPEVVISAVIEVLDKVDLK